MSSRASHTAHGWWARLFGNRAQSEAAQRLAGMERQLAELRGRVEALHAAVGQAAERAAPDLDALHQALQGLNERVREAKATLQRAAQLARKQGKRELAQQAQEMRSAVGTPMLRAGIQMSLMDMDMSGGDPFDLDDIEDFF